jgi:predicted transposase/invertase (TIGR01784 family)
LSRSGLIRGPGAVGAVGDRDAVSISFGMSYLCANTGKARTTFVEPALQRPSNDDHPARSKERLLDFDLFREPEQQDQAVWCFEMRDVATPTVRLGEELQLNVIELKKAERLGRLPPALSAWITLFEHWQEEQRMSAITDEPVRRAYDKLKALSADEDARYRAFVRERALHDEATLLEEAGENGLREGLREGRDGAMREAATTMIRDGALDDATIAAYTGLPVEEIAALRRGS